MNNNKNVEQLIEEAMGSLDTVKRASPMPFLLTRIRARINKKNVTAWEKISWFIGRPSIAIPGLVILIVLNVLAVTFNKEDSFATTSEQISSSLTDEFTYTVATIYDLENIEP